MHVAARLYALSKCVITLPLIVEIIIYMDKLMLFELNMQQKVMKKQKQKQNFNKMGI